MLGKLFKHEWKSTWRIPVILILALWVMTVLTGLTFRSPLFTSSGDALGDFFLVILWLLFYFFIIGVSLGVTLYIVIRFYKSMFTDEGYLTHTLPVSTHQLLLSKMLNMTLWQFLTTLAIGIAFLILGLMAKLFSSDPHLISELQEFLEAVRSDLTGTIPLILSILLLFVVSCFSGSLTMIGSVSLGQMLGKHKILGSIGGYFLIATVMQILMMLLMIPSMFTFEYESEATAVSHMLTRTYLGCTGISAAMAIGLYFLSYYLIDKKLNLD